MTEVATERAFPIYFVSVKWEEDGETKWEDSKGSAPGRRKNATSWHVMHREEQDPEELRERILSEWWPEYIERKNIVRPTSLTVTVEFSRRDEWCLSWFEHWTFDDGQTDAEVLESFERYVSKYERMQDFHPGDPPEGYVCLMGAEDRWRWCGSGESGESDSRTPPPCRCKHCRAQGKIRIGH